MRRRTTGFTLLEILIASIVLVGIVLITSASFFPLKQASTTAILNSDVDDNARRIMLQIRRDLRQSGSEGTTDQITSPPTPGAGAETANVLTFKKRVSLGSDPVADWSPQITYQLLADGNFEGIAGNPARFRLVRTEGGFSVTIAKNISSLEFQRDPGDASVLVTFEIMRPDPNWTGSTPPDPIRRTYRDRIALRN